MDSILGDETKFEKLPNDPTKDLKKRISALNKVANQSQDSISLPKVEGEFAPGYVYGTVKTHKEGNPLRPIIAQMSSPTYWTAKTLNGLLMPYLPKGNTVKNSIEFIIMHFVSVYTKVLYDIFHLFH